MHSRKTSSTEVEEEKESRAFISKTTSDQVTSVRGPEPWNAVATAAAAAAGVMLIPGIELSGSAAGYRNRLLLLRLLMMIITDLSTRRGSRSKYFEVARASSVRADFLLTRIRLNQATRGGRRQPADGSPRSFRNPRHATAIPSPSLFSVI